jgi:hypothetical protein
VFIAGTLDKPVIENHSSKTIVAYTVEYIFDYGKMRLAMSVNIDYPAIILGDDHGVRPGESRTITSAMRPISSDTPVSSDTLKLVSILYSDGQYVGGQGNYDYSVYASNIAALREFGQSLINGGHIPSHLQTLLDRSRQVGHKKEWDALTVRMMASDVLRRIEGADDLVAGYDRMVNFPQLWK